MMPFMIVISIRKGSRKKKGKSICMYLSRNNFSHSTALNCLKTRKKNIFYLIKKIFSFSLALKKREWKFTEQLKRDEKWNLRKIRGWPHRIMRKNIKKSNIIYYLWHAMWLLHKSPSPSHTWCRKRKQLSYVHELSSIFLLYVI